MRVLGINYPLDGVKAMDKEITKEISRRDI